MPTPASETAFIEAGLTRMLTLSMPNGGLVRFVAQAGVSDAQLLRVRRVFRFYLSDAPGTRYGADKTTVAEALSARRATLVYFNTEADAQRAQNGPLQRTQAALQDLYATESPIEGSRDYLDSTVRDATYEELFHLLHGAGIQPALSAYQAQIEAATQAALRNNVWTPSPAQLAEWRAEGSESFEYIISVIDVYYGLWEHAPPPSFDGEYQPSTRASLSRMDPLGLDAVRAFLPEHVDHWVDLDSSFEGTFHLTLDPSLPYTLKSQHLRNVGLTGTASASIAGNALNNTLRGNIGPNTLDGAGGEDTVVYCAPRSRFAIRNEGSGVRVAGPEGTDLLRNIEHIHFSDRVVDL